MQTAVKASAYEGRGLVKSQGAAPLVFPEWRRLLLSWYGVERWCWYYAHLTSQPRMCRMRSLAVLLCLVSGIAVAQPLGPGNPPPGANDFLSMHRRAEWVKNSVTKLVPKANGRCIYAVALEIIGLTEAEWSNDVKERGGKPRTVRKGEEKAYKDALNRNAKSECGDDGNGPPSSGGLYETVRGLLTFASEQEEWEVANFDDAKRGVLRAAEGLLRLGVFVPAVSASVAAGVVANASALVTLDPTVFHDPTRPPPDGL